jgi:hypothetical protein
MRRRLGRPCQLACLPTAIQPRLSIVNRSKNGPERSHNALQVPGFQINSRWRLRSMVVIQVALALPLLSASAVAFDRSVAGVSITESYAESTQLFLQSLQDANGLRVESQFESISKFGAKFSAVDMDKQSKKLHFGLFSITTSYTNSKTLFGAGPPTETKQDQTIALDLTGLRNLWSLSPSAVYVNSFVKETPYQTISSEGSDRTTGISAGASWGWNGGNANVSYWNYSLDSRPTEQPYNSAGRGFDASIGAYVNMIGVYAGFSYNDTEELATFSNSVARAQDAYVSVSYKPQYLPDIVAGGSIGRYQYNNFVSGIADDATYWSATLGFDFSKFLWSPPETKTKPTAKLFYKYYSPTDHSTVAATPASSQFLGMMFRAALD